MRAATLVTALLVLVCTSAAPAPKEPSAARRFLQLSGSDAAGKNIADQIVRQVRPEVPTVPAAFWEEFTRGVDAEAFLDELAPVYEKHFTPEELAELVKFYESPVGQKLVRVQPALNRDTIAAGQRFGTKMTKDLMRRLKDQGYLRK